MFPPMDYSTCGLSEENAILKFGEDNVEVHMRTHTTYNTHAVVIYSMSDVLYYFLLLFALSRKNLQESISLDDV
jgi:phosphoribosyl-ATP pyrophosphohydrolase